MYSCYSAPKIPRSISACQRSRGNALQLAYLCKISASAIVGFTLFSAHRSLFRFIFHLFRLFGGNRRKLTCIYHQPERIVCLLNSTGIGGMGSLEEQVFFAIKDHGFFNTFPTFFFIKTNDKMWNCARKTRNIKGAQKAVRLVVSTFYYAERGLFFSEGPGKMCRTVSFRQFSCSPCDSNSP